MIVDIIKENNRFVIYGAQVIAYGAYVAISNLTGRLPEAFVVNQLDGNPKEIDDIPVKTIDSVSKDIFIIVGVTELIQKEVVPYLHANGYNNTFVLNQHEEHLLMSAYYKNIGKFPLLDMNAKYTAVDLALFEVRNHRDNLLEKPPELKDYEYPIQAGADISNKRVADILDNSGENISSKNKQYCEMSATYWVWKNTNHRWKGIEHYRRHLLVGPELLSEEIDVVMPLPYICYPDTMTQFRRFVSEDVLLALLKALQELYPDKYNEYHDILFGEYQYTYNIVCAKEEVFEAYCEWFFKITQYMEEMADEVPEIKETRALSYVAEVLTNLYFMYHQGDLEIRHCEKAIYI